MSVFDCCVLKEMLQIMPHGTEHELFFFFLNAFSNDRTKSKCSYTNLSLMSYDQQDTSI